MKNYPAKLPSLCVWQRLRVMDLCQCQMVVHAFKSKHKGFWSIHKQFPVAAVVNPLIGCLLSKSLVGLVELKNIYNKFDK